MKGFSGITRKVDILFVAHNRLDFTRRSLTALLRNTAWHRGLVGKVCLYDDQSSDGTGDLLLQACAAMEFAQHGRSPHWYYHFGHFGGPVAVMKHFLDNRVEAPLFAKIDNDLVVPELWLETTLWTMENNPGLGLLGVEPGFIDPTQRSSSFLHGFQPAPHIGGIGLMRTSEFAKRPPLIPNGRFGFTEWQHRQQDLVKGWLCPEMPFCLLDRLPFEPWRSLSEQYVAAGWSRPWSKYDDQWSWVWAGL